MDDRGLVRRFVDDSAREAFEGLVRRHWGWVNGMARRITGEAAMADDVTQAVFVLLARKAKGLRREMRLANWLFTVTRYCAQNAVRAEVRRRRHEQRVAAMRGEAQAPGETPAWEEIAPLIDEAVGALRRADREAVLLRFYQQKTFAEVGETLMISEEAARKRVARAVEELRGRIGRNGVTIGAGALGAMLAANLVTGEASAAVVAGAVTAVAKGGAVPALAKGVGAAMAWTVAKPLAAVVCIGAVVAGLAGVAVMRTPPATAAATTAPAVTAAVATPAEGDVYHGRVVTPDGKPVAGARVYMVESDSWALERRKTVGSATADAEGRFRMTAGAKAAGRVAAVAEGFGWSIGLVSPEATEEEPDEIELARPAEARVRFVDVDGKAVAGVQVAAVAIHNKRPFAYADLPSELDDVLVKTTDANGECVFGGMPYDGIVHLEVHDDRYAQGNAHRTVPAGEADAKVLKLERAAEISGRIVLDKDGAPAAGVCVGVQATNDNREGGWGSAVTDAQGNYRVRRLVPGQYNIGADLRGELEQQYTAAALERVTLETGQQLGGQDFRLIAGGVVTGRAMMEGTGEPVPGLFIGVHGPARPRSGAWIQSTQTGADGRFAIRVPPGVQYVYRSSQLPPGLQGKGGQDGRDVKVEDGGTATTEFVFRRIAAPAVRGQVVDVAGKPVARARVMVEQQSAMPFEGAGPVETDAEGRFSIPGVANGARITAAKGRATTEKAEVVGARNRELTLVIRAVKPASARVLVCTADGKPVEGMKVGLVQMQGQFGLTVEERITSAEGVVSFRKLSTVSQYSVSVSGKGYGKGHAALALRPGEEVEARVTVPRANSFIAGQAVDGEGKAVVDAEVQLSGGRSSDQAVRSDVDGRFRFDGVVEGDTPLVYVRRGNEHIRAEDVKAGQDDVVIIVPGEGRGR